MKLTPDGKQALLRLSKGDMRRALNVLQACHAAYDTIGETEVYNCTGSPHPSDIETIVNSMLSDEFTTSIQSTLLVIQVTVANAYFLSGYGLEDRARTCTARYAFWCVRVRGNDRFQTPSASIPLGFHRNHRVSRYDVIFCFSTNLFPSDTDCQLVPTRRSSYQLC